MFIHISSFRGKANWSKVRVLALLYIAEQRGYSSLTVRQIAINSGGVSTAYLFHRLPLWVRWHYLKRSASLDGFRYSLAVRGNHFIEGIVPGLGPSRAFSSIGGKEG